MSTNRPGPGRSPSSPAAEIALLFLVSAAGIYSLGQGFAGLLHPATHAWQTAWFVVTWAAIQILFRQMVRVHQRCPRRRPELERVRKRISSATIRWWWPASGVIGHRSGLHRSPAEERRVNAAS